jgi:hypothetical protein
MKITRSRVAGLSLASIAVMAGCWATASGPGGGVEVGVGLPYTVGPYEPGGYEYGGWSSNYYVAPPIVIGDRDRRDHDDRDRRDRDDRDRRSHEVNRRQNPAYRPAPQSRQAPSLPSRRPQH